MIWFFTQLYVSKSLFSFIELFIDWDLVSLAGVTMFFAAYQNINLLPDIVPGQCNSLQFWQSNAIIKQLERTLELVDLLLFIESESIQ